MILSCAAMRAVEERAFADGITAEQLMEEAGAAIARAVRQTFPRPGLCLAVFGKGNNGGDALVAARHLAEAGWDTRLVGAFPESKWGELPRKKFAEAARCKAADLHFLETARAERLVVLDGLLGIGAQGALRDHLAACTRAINALRARGNARVFALDLPTGLNGDTGAADPACVVADTTFTIGFAKLGLLADTATNFVGRLRVLPLLELGKRAGSLNLGAMVVDAEHLRGLLPRRRFDTHKGQYGRVGIVAGSTGMLGAAALCADACVRAGAGLVTLHAEPGIAERLSIIAPREVMVRPAERLSEVTLHAHDVLAVGPGLGMRRADEVQELVWRAPQPMVLDADGLNSIAVAADGLIGAAGERVLTPHPGEMARLAPELAGHSRAEVARQFARRFPKTTLLLKGARTILAREGEPLAYNSTGTPGMATGGMGDVLTGVVAALLAQGLAPFVAAKMGAWLCGRAGEIAIDQGGATEETLTPSVLLDHLPSAFQALRAGE